MRTLFILTLTCILFLSNTASEPLVGAGSQLIPDLYVISVGIDKYPYFPLENCTNDATALIKKILKDSLPILKNKSTTRTNRINKTSTQNSRPKGKIYTHLLLNEDATLENIKKAFKDVIKASKTKDYFIFYFAGHSEIVEPNEQYLYTYKRIIGEKNTNNFFTLSELASLMNQVSSTKQLLISEASHYKI